MSDAPGVQAAVERDWPVDRRPFESPAGLRLLVPGWPQFSWGQRERGWVLLGSFVVGRWRPGSWPGGPGSAWCFFAFALPRPRQLDDRRDPAGLLPGLSPGGRPCR